MSPATANAINATTAATPPISAHETTAGGNGRRSKISSACSNKRPPSSAGIGSKLTAPNATDNNAINPKNGAKPARAESPLCCAMPMGP